MSAEEADGKPKDIAGKLQYLCNILEVSEQTFVNEMYRDHKSRKEDVRGWLKGITPPKKPSLEKLTKYWNGSLNGFLYFLWLVRFEKFENEVQALRARQDTVAIPLPCDGNALAQDEIKGLVGTYVTHRKAFSNDGRVSRELLIISPAKDGSRVLLDVELSPTSIDDPDEDDPAEEPGPANVFKGQLFKLGDAYYIAASVREGPRSRIRFLCFPVGQRPSLRRRWGVISGVAGSSRLPVAARILITKLRKGVEAPRPQRGTPQEVGPAPEDLRYISNDISRPLATFRESDAVLLVSGEFE
jgi:hypothetical protein